MNSPSFSQVLEETTLILIFAQGKMLVDVGRQSTARVKLLPHHPSLLHLRPAFNQPPSFTFPTQSLTPASSAPGVPPGSSDAISAAAPLLWLLLLCPINQPVYFYLGNLWQEVGSMAH